MFTQKSIKIFHSVQEIRPLSLFQNLALDKAATDDKCRFAIDSLFSEFEPRQKNSTNLKCHLTISWGTSCQYQCVCKISSQHFTQFKRQRHYHFFPNLELGKASTNEKCHFAISWARSCQYQCLRNSLSKYSTQFKR